MRADILRPVQRQQAGPPLRCQARKGLRQLFPNPPREARQRQRLREIFHSRDGYLGAHQTFLKAQEKILLF